MKKKQLGLVIVILVLSIFATGCSKAPNEKLADAYLKTQTLKSNQSIMEISVDVDSDDLAIVSGLFNHSKISVESKVDNEKKLGEVFIDLSVMGMVLEGEVLKNNETVAVKMPFITSILGIGDKYILTDMDELENEENIEFSLLSNITDRELKQEQNKIIKEIIKENMSDELIMETENIELETPEGTIKGSELKIQLNNEQVKKLAKEFLVKTMDSKKLSDSISAYINEQEIIQENEITEDDLRNDPGKVIDLLFDNASMDLDIEFFLDKDGYIRNLNLNVNMSIVNEETSAPLNLTLNLNQNIWNINKSIDIDIPEFNEENSIKSEEIENDFKEMALY